MTDATAQRTIEQFLRRTRVRFRVLHTLSQTRPIAWLSAVVVAACWIALPEFLGAASIFGVTTILLVAAVTWTRLRFDVPALDAQHGLRGWLSTFAESARHQDPTARAWLRELLAARLAKIPVEESATRLVARFRRPARAVLVALLILLLLRLLWLPPLPDGVLPLGGRSASVGRESPSIEGPRETGTRPSPAQPRSGEASATAQGGSPPPPSDQTERDPPPGGRSGSDPGAVPHPIAPLDLPIADVFAMPALIEDTARDGGSARSTQVSPSPSVSLADPASSATDAPDDPRVFDRAREAALHSHHVPDEERDAVRAWFDSLVRRHR